MVDIRDTLKVKPGPLPLDPSTGTSQKRRCNGINSYHHHYGEPKLFVVFLLDLATHRDKESVAATANDATVERDQQTLWNNTFLSDGRGPTMTYSTPTLQYLASFGVKSWRLAAVSVRLRNMLCSTG
jgi:hypothetical protein